MTAYAYPHNLILHLYTTYIARSYVNDDVDVADLIERAQFALNAKIYRPGEFEELEKLGFEGSWLQWFLFEIECFHGKSSLLTSKPAL
jgi:hypothetical protein